MVTVKEALCLVGIGTYTRAATMDLPLMTGAYRFPKFFGTIAYRMCSLCLLWTLTSC